MTQKAMMPYDAAELTNRGMAWLRSARRCPVVIRETGSYAGSLERCDVIGFAWDESIVLEVKVSRSDFLNDAKKPARQNPKRGLGDRRLYVTPKGLVKPSELPEGWGLLEPRGGGLRASVYGLRFVRTDQALAAERLILISYGAGYKRGRDMPVHTPFSVRPGSLLCRHTVVRRQGMCEIVCVECGQWMWLRQESDEPEVKAALDEAEQAVRLAQ